MNIRSENAGIVPGLVCIIVVTALLLVSHV